MRDVLLIGMGYWGKNWARVLNDLGRLSAVVDRRESIRISVENMFPSVQQFNDIEEALKIEEIKAVCIATPAASHAELVIRCLKAGKDVLVEKPMCLTKDEGLSMLEAAEDTGQLLMVGHLLLYHPAVVKLKKMIRKGELGKLQYIYSNRLNLGKVRVQENTFWSFAPHDISVINHLLGETPEWVQAGSRDCITQKINDITISTLGYPSGVAAHIFVSWLHPFKEQRLVLIGDKQMAVFSDTSKHKLILYPHTIEWIDREPTPIRGEAQEVPIEEAEPLLCEAKHFLECVDKRTSPVTDGKHGMSVVDILLASDDSVSNSGKRILLSKSDPITYFVHDTACVDSGVQIGNGTKIWHFSHVMPEASIGMGCSLGQNVHIARGVKVGDQVKIQNNVSIYEGVEIEDQVFLGPSCVLTNVKNPRSEINRQQFYEKTLLRKGCSIGANSTIVCGIEIGRYSFVASGAVVTKNVPDYALMVGVPAIQQGWMSRHGIPLTAPNKEDGVMSCPESGMRYKEVSPGRVICLDVSEDDPLPAKWSKSVQSYSSLKEQEKWKLGI